MWLASFLAGFSDRMAESMLKVLGGRITGGRLNELVTMDSPAGLLGANLGDLLDRLGWSKKSKTPEMPAKTPETPVKTPEMHAEPVAPNRAKQEQKRKAERSRASEPAKADEAALPANVVALDAGPDRDQA